MRDGVTIKPLELISKVINKLIRLMRLIQSACVEDGGLDMYIWICIDMKIFYTSSYLPAGFSLKR